MKFGWISGTSECNLLALGGIKDALYDVSLCDCGMLVRQATLACQRAFTQIAARAATFGASSSVQRDFGTCTKNANPKILITGGLGQLGMPLAKVFR